MHRVTVLLVLSLAFIFGLAYAQESPMVVVDDVETTSMLYYNHTSHIARNSDGDLVTVWTSADDQVQTSVYDDAFMIWSAAPISSAGDAALKAGVAADDNGNIYAVWQQRETSDQDYAVYFSKFDGSTWTTPVNLTGNDLENEEASVNVSSDGTVFIAWNTDAEPDGSEWVLSIHSTDQGATWSSPPDTLSSADGIIGGSSTTSGRPFLAAGPGGKMVAAWHEEPDGHPDREMFFSYFDGSGWSDEDFTIDVADSANSMYGTVALDSESNIYMVYRSFGPSVTLLKKKGWDEASWPESADTVVSPIYESYKPFLGIDGNDNMYMVFRMDNLADTLYGLEDIGYVTSADRGVSWTEPVRLNRENYDGGYVTLAPRIGPDGVDVLWREAAKPFFDEGDTDSGAVVYGRIDLLETAIEDIKNMPVQDYQLSANYPNPFNPSTTFYFTVPQAGIYEVAVYDVMGKKVRTLYDENFPAGIFSATWDATSDKGVRVASGIYFYNLKGENINLTRKMVLMR